MSGKLSIPSHFEPHARTLLRSLLTPDVGQRLTSIEEIKRHPWFQRVDWAAIAVVRCLVLTDVDCCVDWWCCVQRRGKPPFVPVVSAPDDVHNFDTYSRSEDDDTGTTGFRGRKSPKKKPKGSAEYEEPPEMFNNADFASL